MIQPCPPARSAAAETRQDGFSLVELLVVLAIIGMITTLVAPQVLAYLGRAKTDTARIQAKNLAQAVELYYLDVGAYPAANQGLAALLTAPPGAPQWRGPYLRAGTGIADPWSRPFLYRVPGPNGAPFEIVSLGRDGQPGGTGEDADASSN